jgi:hypothetical protein
LVGRPSREDRFKDKHDEFDHEYQDFNDYKYIDSMKGCYGKDWLE